MEGAGLSHKWGLGEQEADCWFVQEPGGDPRFQFRTTGKSPKMILYLQNGAAAFVG